MNFSTCTYIVPTNCGVHNGRTNPHRRDRIYAVRRFIAAQLINSKNEAGNHPYSAYIGPRWGDESPDAIMAFTVGTAFMPSSDSSQHITMNPGGRHVEAVHGDESPDAINRVPTRMWIGQWGRMIGRRGRND